jgi:FlaA1/EpsC-like NDP-sugar epimerase
MIGGGAGSIGSELARQVHQFNKNILIWDNNESGLFDITQELVGTTPILADIRDLQEVIKYVERHKPDIIFHCAAYKHVPMLEMYPEAAMKNNIMGTQNLGFTAVKNKVKKFVFISTDKAVKPNCVMGQTKGTCENMCLKMAENSKTSFVVVRFGNVLSSRGSIVPILQKQIDNNETLTITDEKMERYFITGHEVCGLTLETATMPTGKYTFDMGKPIKIIDLAKYMLMISGKVLPINIIGSRPGEKLSEKLYGPDEKLVKTANPKIWQILKKSVKK